jgi:AraC-like DNA-binding protein
VSGFDFSVLNFSTEQFPDSERLAMLREHYGRTVLKAEIEITKDVPFEARIESHILPDLHLLSGTLSPARITRTRAQIADGDDHLALVVSRTSSIAVTSRGREVLLQPGDGVLTSSQDVTTFERICKGDSFSLRVPRSALTPLVVNADDAVMHLIPCESGALQFLKAYAAAVMDEKALSGLSSRQIVVAHIHDLLALTLEAPRDIAEIAKERGGKAALLQAAKTYVVNNSSRQDLSIGSVAAHLDVTPRHLQRLFESDGTTFSSFVLCQRLTRAHRMLCKLQFAGRSVSAIAYDAGFGDLSYFNRCFRRFYGVTPSDVRNGNTGGAAT